jgi:hypothetical protein
VRGLDLRPLLHVRTDHLCACGAGEVGKLDHLVANALRSRIWKQDANEVRTLARLTGCDQRRSISIRFIASAIRASGAVTDNRK